MDYDLALVLLSFVGKTYTTDDGRDVRILQLVGGKLESFYICLWTDTYMCFTASCFDVASSMEYSELCKRYPESPNAGVSDEGEAP